ncbi:MAG TPA: GspH/FimT family protein [Vicinamibacterales bacterium]|nr:GspH/FimT family protein [Vicinamibacterales bacterium]
MIELVAVTAVITILGGATAARVLSSVDHSRGYAAARYLAGRMALARTQAVARSTAVGLRFTQESAGFTFAVFQDGNGNGIRTADIQSGVDRPSQPSTSLFEQFPGVDIGLSPQSPATSAVQLGQTNLLTFTPLGTATSGTIYVRDQRGTQWAVRVLGATGRIRVLRYDPRTGNWLVAQ